MTSPSPAAPCRLQSVEVDEPMAGTAPSAVGWLALEQPGPWGRTALSQSRLDPAVGARIQAACADAGVRPALVRRPGRVGPAGPRTLLVAHCRPGASWLLTAEVTEPAAVPWEALAKAAAIGEADQARALLPGAVASGPRLLVCANGRRDVCCAVVGRPLAVEVAAHAPGRVWEATHLGGHRFSPTAALLPSGMLHGRLSGPAALEVLRAADRGDVVVESARGRTTWPGPGQAAELAVRRLTGERRDDALSVEQTETPGRWLVRHLDGTSWLVPVVERTADVGRAESCGKAAVPVCSWESGRPEPLG